MTVMMYRLIKVLSDGIVGLSSEFGRQLWCICKMHKQHECQECGQSFPIGAEMYRPLSNGFNRMRRLCKGCVCLMVKTGEKTDER